MSQVLEMTKEQPEINYMRAMHPESEVALWPHQCGVACYDDLLKE